MEYRGFHLQHQYTTSSVTQSHYKPFITRQPWNSSNSNIYSSNNGYINSRDVGQDFDFQAQQQRPSESDDLLVARIKDEEGCVNDSIIFSSISEGEPHSQSQQYCHAANNCQCHVQKPILIEGGRGRGIALSKRYYNFKGGASSSSSRLSSSLSFNSEMSLGGSGSGSGLLQLSYDSFALNEDQHSICLSHSNNMQKQHPQNSPSNSSNQISAFLSGAARTKTPRKYCSQPKELSDTKPNKKSRSSCSPIKVLKEKMGDRIQTLQKLLAPFGKTNTASVLTEAIGYIHFLHGQIQTLSVPYMKSSQTRPLRMVQLGSKEEDSRESNCKPDLRSRGLCLVPLSYASYIHNFD